MELSLEVEHAWATEALTHAHDALEAVHRTHFAWRAGIGRSNGQARIRAS